MSDVGNAIKISFHIHKHYGRDTHTIGNSLQKYQEQSCLLMNLRVCACMDQIVILENLLYIKNLDQPLLASIELRKCVDMLTISIKVLNYYWC